MPHEKLLNYPGNADGDTPIDIWIDMRRQNELVLARIPHELTELAARRDKVSAQLSDAIEPPSITGLRAALATIDREISLVRAKEVDHRDAVTELDRRITAKKQPAATGMKPADFARRLLGLQEGDNVERLKSRYRELAKSVHPDVNGSEDAEDQFKLLNWAYRLLLEALEQSPQPASEVA
ncbi:MAG TPA: J domain-containing protein [Magnetospirillaceae bacterium]